METLNINKMTANKNIVETLTGLSVILVAIFFLSYAYFGKETRKDYNGNTYNINFDRVDGLAVGSDVKVSGLKVGTVLDAEIDNETYQAKVTIDVDREIKVPDDSTAEIISAGLLGDKYVAIVPGGSEKSLKNGETIRFSQPSISIESLIGKFIFGSSDDKQKDKKEDDDDIFN